MTAKNQGAAEHELLSELLRQAEQGIERGDGEAARQIYEAVLQIDPNHPLARQALGLPPPAQEAALRSPETGSGDVQAPPGAVEVFGEDEAPASSGGARSPVHQRDEDDPLAEILTAARGLAASAPSESAAAGSDVRDGGSSLSVAPKSPAAPDLGFLDDEPLAPVSVSSSGGGLDLDAPSGAPAVLLAPPPPLDDEPPLDQAAGQADAHALPTPPPAGLGTETTLGVTPAAPRAVSPLRGRIGIPLMRRVLVGVGAAAALAATTFFVGEWRGWWRPAAPASISAASTVQRATPIASQPTPPAPSSPAPGGPSSAPLGPTPEDAPRLVAEARARLDQQDPVQAVALLVTALKLEPANLDALRLLDQAKKQAIEVQRAVARIAEAKALFAQEDFEEALRLMYRIPDDRRPANLDRWMANSWYNLGVQRLKSGDVGEALGFFRDGLELAPADPSARRHLEAAKRYRGQPLDSAYWIYANALELRGLEERPE